MYDVSLLLSIFPVRSTLTGLTAALALGCTGLALIIPVCLAGARSRQLNLHLARHLVRLSSIAGGILFFAMAAWCFTAPRLAIQPEGTGLAALCGLNGLVWWNTPYRCALLASLGLGALAPLVALLVSSCWRKMRSIPVVLWFCCLAMTLIMLGLCALSVRISKDLFPAITTTLANTRTGFWPLLASTLFGGIATGSALSLFWLLIRRNADDFGRDYYAFASRKCARFTVWNTSFALLAQVILLVSILAPLAGEQAVSALALPNEISLAALSATCSSWYASLNTLIPVALAREASLLFTAPGLLLSSLLAILGACIVARATIPMRHKPSMVLCWILLFAGVVCLSRILSVFSA